MIKLFKYRTAGVREYWIVDDNKGRVTVYNKSIKRKGMKHFEPPPVK